MMLDTKNNTTGNNEAEEKEQAQPQSIFEQEQAENIAAEQDPLPGPDGKLEAQENSAGALISGATASHEGLPPVVGEPRLAPQAGSPENPEPAAQMPPADPAMAETVVLRPGPASQATQTPEPPQNMMPGVPNQEDEQAFPQALPAAAAAGQETPVAAVAAAPPAAPEEGPAAEAPAHPFVAGQDLPTSEAAVPEVPAAATAETPDASLAQGQEAEVAEMPLAANPEAPETKTAESPQTAKPEAPKAETAAPELSPSPVAPGASAPEAKQADQAAPAQTQEAGPESTAPAATAAAANLVEDHHDEHHDEHHEDLVPEIDYNTLSISELRNTLMGALKSASRKNSRQIYDMHRHYETKMASEKAEALQRFIAEGNDADDFDFNAGLAHQEIEQAFQLFRENRNRDQRQEEEQRVKNSQRKNELLEQLRELVESPETRSSSDKIKSIQAEWKTIGPVPTNESQQMWSSYHALLDIFYNNRSIFFELKELDRRKNLQHKLQLCERAEALADNPSINTALQELRNLHEEWKNVGPVPNEFRDSIWERFIQASEKIHARKKEFISERRVQEQDNLVKKQDLLTRIAAYQQYQTDRINDWRDKTDEIQKLKEEWDSIGLVPKERADEVNKQFWASYKAFFNHKNAFFKSLDEQKMQNLRLKTELCEQAEGLKDSTEWDETKEKLIQLQKKWKTIGRVPDKYSDKLWNRFRAACNEFFDRKQNQVQQREAASNKASAEKMAYYDEVTARVANLTQQPATLEELEAIRNKWESFEASRGQNKLDDKFFELLQQFVAAIPDLSTEEKAGINIELQVDHIRQSPDAGHRLHQKEQSIRKEISHLENDIRTLKTNIEFFGRSKNAEKLKEEYQARIDEADHRIQILQQQLYAFRNA